MDYLTAAAAPDGTLLIAYMPTERPVTVDMSRLSRGLAHAWWYNPRTGDAASIGVYPTAGRRSFTPPGAGDWVLVVDDAARNLPAPGLSAPKP
jgi:hypothetical protein